MTAQTFPSRPVGYVRVSTYGQTLDAHLDQLRRAGCAKIFREKATGARPDRQRPIAGSIRDRRRTGDRPQQSR